MLSVRTSSEASRSAWAIRCVVLDLPFVPVTPIVNSGSAHGNGAGVGRCTCPARFERARASNSPNSSSSPALGAYPVGPEAGMLTSAPTIGHSIVPCPLGATAVSHGCNPQRPCSRLLGIFCVFADAAEETFAAGAVSRKAMIEAACAALSETR